jgi:hypothetical protein
MYQTEFIGMMIVGLSTLVGLFIAIFKPINENTKTMTELLLKMDVMTEKMDERDEELKQHIKDFEDYKNKVRESQKRQWNKIDELSDDMIKIKHSIK